MIRTLFVATLERRLDDAHRVRRSKWCPVRLEVAALEAGAADLLGEETVLDRVVDVFEELAVDLRIDRAQTAVGVDLEDGNARGCLSGRLVPQRLEPCGREQDERKQRVFITIVSPDARGLPPRIRAQVIANQRERRTAAGLEGAQRVAAAHTQRLSEQRTNGRALECAVLPRQIDLEPAARSQAGDVTVRPRRRKRRQQANLSLVTLQQHLGDCRRAAEVAVDLKRRVRVEHVGVGTLGAEQELQDVVTRGCRRRASPRD